MSLHPEVVVICRLKGSRSEKAKKKASVAMGQAKVSETSFHTELNRHESIHVCYLGRVVTAMVRWMSVP